MLSDFDVLTMIKNQSLIIDPFNRDHLTPNGYDLSVGKIRLEKSKTKGKYWVKIPPNAWFLISTKESIALGRQTCASLWIKSTWARLGIIGSFGKVDAGFEGKLVLSFLNFSRKALTISTGQPIVQITFEKMQHGTSRDYKERGGKYHRQPGL